MNTTISADEARSITQKCDAGELFVLDRFDPSSKKTFLAVAGELSGGTANANAYTLQNSNVVLDITGSDRSFIFVATIQDRVPIPSLFYAIGLFTLWDMQFGFEPLEIANYYSLSQLDGDMFFSLQHVLNNIAGLFLAKITAPEILSELRILFEKEAPFPQDNKEVYAALLKYGLKLFDEMSAPVTEGEPDDAAFDLMWAELIVPIRNMYEN